MSTILVVDDMAVFREPIAAALRQKGYQTICAGNGKEAMGTARQKRPDLILLDVAMPEMDGLTFMEAMQEDPHLQGVPVVLLTAIAERDSVVEAIKLGAREYLLKSQFSLDEMVDRIENCLGQAGAQPLGETDRGDDPQPDSGPGDAEEDIDLETTGTFTDPEGGPSPVEGLEDVSDDLTAAEIVQHIENSAELSALTSDIGPDEDTGAR